MAITIAVANRKGGIGKTTTALALANGLKNRNFKVLVIDTDPQRNSSGVLHAKTDSAATLYDIFFGGFRAIDCIQHPVESDIDIIASDENLQNIDAQMRPSPNMYKHLKKSLNELRDSVTYDFIIIDTPPSVGLLLGNVLTVTDYLIIPCSCDLFGIQGITDFYETVLEYQEDNPTLKILGLLIIKYKMRQNLTMDIEKNLLPEYAKLMNTKIFNTKIRESVKCQEAQTLRKSIYDYAPKCTTAIDYNNLIDEILNEIYKEGK